MTRIALALVLRDGKVLISRRREDDHLGGWWEFPGGKVRPGEDPASAALRELEEETSLTGGTAVPLAEAKHQYPDREVHLMAYLVRGAHGEAQARASREVRWVAPAAIEPGILPPANASILDRLRQVMAGREG